MQGLSKEGMIAIPRFPLPGSFQRFKKESGSFYGFELCSPILSTRQGITQGIRQAAEETGLEQEVLQGSGLSGLATG